MKQGDLVMRKSYGGDVIFIVDRIENLNRQHEMQDGMQNVILKGYDFRLLADAPIGDLIPMNDVQSHRSYQIAQDKVRESWQWIADIKQLQKEQNEKKNGNPAYFEMPGKVLHLDGDPLYLRKSMMVYEKLRVPAEGRHIAEANMPEAIYQLIPQVRPDILVITGHDGLLKSQKEGGIYSLNNYKNSLNFTKAVKVARQYERNRDALIIIAGACQSHFEALLQAGANFASSPGRILIHALDPVYIASKASYTSIKETINIHEVISHTISGLQGLGGIESQGSYRIGVPGMAGR